MTAAPDPTNLCTACGLCCNGALFDFGPLLPEEAQQARRDGLAVLEAEGEFAFTQPCPALEGAACTVYATRPGTCRAYACELLLGLQAGTVSMNDALAHVGRAREAAAEAIAQLPPGATLADARRLRREAAASEGAAIMIAPPGLMIALGLLDLVLDQHFRKTSERQVMPRG